jgi:hypothetical protein
VYKIAPGRHEIAELSVLLRTLAIDRSVLTSIGASGRAHAEAHHRIDHIAGELAEAFRRYAIELNAPAAQWRAFEAKTREMVLRELHERGLPIESGFRELGWAL